MNLSSPILVFDLETVPDAVALRKLDSSLPENDSEAVKVVIDEHVQKHGNSFLPHYLHRIIAISCVYRGSKKFSVRSLGKLDDEYELLETFFSIIEKRLPILVSWNGNGFDLPVLHYRSLFHGITSSKYWDLGDRDKSFRYNNYISRYHFRHIDLMDLLAGYQSRANAPLDVLTRLCGFPGKIGMDGSKVWDAYQQGRLDAIRAYCETDVVNTYLLFCRFQLIRGILTKDEYNDEISSIKENLSKMEGEHWSEYCSKFEEKSFII